MTPVIAITVLNRDRVAIGPFTREQIEDKLKSGECTLSDLAFMQGLTQWAPLGQVLARIGSPAIASSVASVAGTPAYSYAATMQPPGHLVYAGFWIRFVAYFIDGLVISVPIFFIAVIFNLVVLCVAVIPAAARHASSDSYAVQLMSILASMGILFMSLVLIIIVVVIAWLYFAVLESGPHQATFGKRALGLKVTSLTGERISFARATGRFFAKSISKMMFYIGFIMTGFTERKQALHDYIASTLVIRK